MERVLDAEYEDVHDGRAGCAESEADVSPHRGFRSDPQLPVGEGTYRCRICPDSLILASLRERTLHEKWHRKGFECPVQGCRVLSTSTWQQMCHREWHRTGLPYPCRLGCEDTWFRLASQQADHHLYQHGTRFRDEARARGLQPRLFTGNFNIPLVRRRPEKPWFDREGRQQGCWNCRREKSQHWHTLEPGVSVQCQSCGDWFRRKGTFRRTDMPVRGRQLPLDSEAVRKAPCTNCGAKPGRYAHWGRGPGNEILCPTCLKACEAQVPPKLVPRICANLECGSTHSTQWVKGLCGACYHYGRKNGGEMLPRSVIEE